MPEESRQVYISNNHIVNNNPASLTLKVNHFVRTFNRNIILGKYTAKNDCKRGDILEKNNDTFLYVKH